jgi:hypothetical protein
VLKKLAHRQMMYDSYALQVHGYITSGNATEEDDDPFILVHGVRNYSYFLKLIWLVLNWVVLLSGFILGHDFHMQSFSYHLRSRLHVNIILQSYYFAFSVNFSKRARFCLTEI